MNQLALWAVWMGIDEPLPTPTDPAFNPADVTPGPIGFIFTAVFMVAVGLLVMSMMTKMSRVNARYQVREELEREAAAKQASGQDSAGQDVSGRDVAGQDAAGQAGRETGDSDTSAGDTSR